MHGSEVLEVKLGAEDIPHFWLIGIVALRIGHASNIDAGKRNKDDTAILINMVLQAEQLDLGRSPSQIILTEVGRIADQ